MVINYYFFILFFAPLCPLQSRCRPSQSRCRRRPPARRRPPFPGRPRIFGRAAQVRHGAGLGTGAIQGDAQGLPAAGHARLSKLVLFQAQPPHLQACAGGGKVVGWWCVCM